MTRHFAAASLVLMALTGCGKGTTTPPPSPTHVFALRPPAVLETPSVRIEILSETLAIYSSGMATREYRTRLDYVGAAGRDTTMDGRTEYTYHAAGDSISFTSACDDTASCPPPPHVWGHFTRTGLELRTQIDPDVVLRYERRYPPD